MVVVGSILHRCLLGQAKKKVGKVVSRPRDRLSTNNLRGIEPGENERAACVAVGLGVELNAAEISAPAPGVLAVVPDQTVGDGECLVAQQSWIGVLQAGVV